MKAIVGVVIGFILRIFALAVVSTLVVTSVRFGAAYDPSASATAGRVFPLILDSAVTVLVPCAVLAFGLSLIALVRVRRFRRTAGTALWLVFVAAVGGFIQYSPFIAGAAPLTGGTLAPAVRAGGVTQFPDADLFVAERDGYSLLNVIVFPHGEDRGFRYEEEAFVDPFAREIEIPGYEQNISLDNALSGPSVVFQPPPFLESTVRYLRESTVLLHERLERSTLHFWVSVLAFCFAAAGAWTGAHLSRWPFLNGVVTFGVLLFLPMVHVLLYDPDVQQVFATVFVDTIRPFAPSIVLVAMGLSLFVLGLVVTSPQRLRLETED